MLLLVLLHHPTLCCWSLISEKDHDFDLRVRYFDHNRWVVARHLRSVGLACDRVLHRRRLRYDQINALRIVKEMLESFGMEEIHHLQQLVCAWKFVIMVIITLLQSIIYNFGQ